MDVSVGLCAAVAIILPATAFVLERYGPERAVFAASGLQQQNTQTSKIPTVLAYLSMVLGVHVTITRILEV